MSKYCEQCGTQLEGDGAFCSECGAKCKIDINEKSNEIDLSIENKKNSKSSIKKKLLSTIAIIILGIIVFVIIESGGLKNAISDFKTGVEEAEKKTAKTEKRILTEDGNAYKMTVQEFCDKFNEIANESWCSGTTEILRMQVEEETRNSFEEAAMYDPDVEELLIQTMTPVMILDTTLLKSEDTDELPNGEDYIKYTYTNQYSFIPDSIYIQILAKKDTNQIVGIATMFPMDYRNIGDKLGKLVCDSWGEDSQTGEFQELYVKMKEAGGYGHTYKEGTVFELMYAENSDTNALFKMSACTKEHYEETWVNNPDVPSKENPIKNTEENMETDTEENINQSSGVQQSAILEMFDNLFLYEGTWGDFGAHVNEYQGMVETAIKSSISLSDYFGDVDGTYMILERRVMNDDVLENGLSATNQLYTITFQGPSVTGRGGARTLECTVSSPDGVNLEYNEVSYY